MDDNFCPTRGYSTRSDPNGSGFTQLDKDQGRVWVFLKKKPATSLGFNKTWRVPDPTIYLSTKIPSYIYSNKTYHLILISFHIFSRPHSPLPVSLSFPLLSSPLTTTATTEPHSLSSLLTTTTPTKPRNPYTGNAGAASSDGHFVLNISFTL